MLIVGLVLPSTPLLAFIGLALLTTTGSSATSHSQHSWITPWTIRPTIWLDLMPGFPSYCTGSLLEIPPSNTKQDWLSIGLRAILHAYPPVLPNQVHLRCVPLTSYGFLQTLPLANNALAIRIIFPSVRVIQVSFNLTGLPASLGKQNKNAHIKWALFVKVRVIACRNSYCYEISSYIFNSETFLTNFWRRVK